ncbi:MAG: alpha/beta fold hydrolase [Parahaliea sp.]
MGDRTVPMTGRLESFGGSGARLVFAHANGYPPGCYRQLLEPLTTRFQVMGYRHRPLWPESAQQAAPTRANWQRFASDLIDTLEGCAEGSPVWMMGHSLGGVVSMLAAVRKPRLFRGVVLLDPVFMPSRRALSLALMPNRALRQIPLVRKTLGRPAQFADHQAMFDFHRGKRAFAGMSDEALWHYVHAGSRATAAGVELAWSPAWEAAVYSSVPLVWLRLPRLRLPTLGLRGEHSDILGEAIMRRWARLQPAAELHTCPGGHLFPLEYPRDTAARVLDFLARQGA